MLDRVRVGDIIEVATLWWVRHHYDRRSEGLTTGLRKVTGSACSRGLKWPGDMEIWARRLAVGQGQGRASVAREAFGNVLQQLARPSFLGRKLGESDGSRVGALGGPLG